MNLRFPMDLYNRLWDIANERNCSIKVLIVDVLIDYVKEHHKQ